MTTTNRSTATLPNPVAAGRTKSKTSPARRAPEAGALIREAERELGQIDMLLRAAELALEASDVDNDEPAQHVLRLIEWARSDAKRASEALENPELLSADRIDLHEGFPWIALFDLQAHVFGALHVFEHVCDWEKSADAGRALQALGLAHAASRKAFSHVDNAAAEPLLAQGVA